MDQPERQRGQWQRPPRTAVRGHQVQRRQGQGERQAEHEVRGRQEHPERIHLQVDVDGLGQELDEAHLPERLQQQPGGDDPGGQAQRERGQQVGGPPDAPGLQERGHEQRQRQRQGQPGQ